MHSSRGKSLLQQQLDLLGHLPESNYKSPPFLEWQRNTRVVISQVFGSGSGHETEFKNISFGPGVYTQDEYRQREFDQRGWDSGCDKATALLKSMLKEIEEFPLLTEPKAAPAHSSLDGICSRFHDIARQLRKRHDDRPTLDVRDEYDVQDLLHALLRLYFNDIRPEEWTPSYAGASSRMDFLLKQEQVVVEAKKTRANLKDKQLGEQLIIDIARYKAHPDCQTLYCFVYDPEGLIANPKGLESDLSHDYEGLGAIVRVRP